MIFLWSLRFPKIREKMRKKKFGVDGGPDAKKQLALSSKVDIGKRVLLLPLKPSLGHVNAPHTLP